MKKYCYSTFIVLCLIAAGALASAQNSVPDGFNYQAVARNSSGTAISETDLKVEITILSDTLLNTVVWKEEHMVTTNIYGLFTLVIGDPVKATRTGGSATVFSQIDWTASQMFVSVGIKNPPAAASFTPMGKAKLWSVPYALVAGDASTPFIISADDEADDPLFEVRRKDGQPVFTVYDDAVTINVSNNPSKKGSPQRGGFAIGGFDESKGETTDLFRVTDDSVRVYIKNPPPGKGSPSRGGFAIGGFDETKGPVARFLDLTPENYFIGHEAGSSTTVGKYNSFIGYQSGKSNVNGAYNILIGYQSGFSLLGPPEPPTPGGQYGSYNVFLGYQTGYSNIHGAHNTQLGYASGHNSTADNNTFVGSMSGVETSTGASNTFIGTMAGMFNRTGSGNALMGMWAGWNIDNGNNNTVIGTWAGADLKSGHSNVIIGNSAMAENFYASDGTASSNVIIGYGAGKKACYASNNIFIGYQAGAEETGSNLLYIDNNSTGTPLIYGNFGLDVFRVNGNIEHTGTISTVSDLALKTNINELTGVTEKLEQIRGVYYEWAPVDNTGLLLKGGRQIGVIAQEVEKVYPELVVTNDKGYKMVDYTKLAPVLLEAVKEQQKMIEDQNEKIARLERLVEQLINNTLTE